MDKRNKLITAAVVAVIAAVSITTVAMSKKDDPMADMNMPDSSNSQMSDSMEMTNNEVKDSNQVTYKGFAVVQKTIKVKKGTTVTWTNEDNAKHDVTFEEDYPGLKNTELFGKGETKSITFDTVGTYKYLCSPHPYMKGTIEVTE